MQLRRSQAVVCVRDPDSMPDFDTGVLGFQITDRGPPGSADLRGAALNPLTHGITSEA